MFKKNIFFFYLQYFLYIQYMDRMCDLLFGIGLFVQGLGLEDTWSLLFYLNVFINFKYLFVWGKIH